jgi:hypothetical protein
MGSKSTRKRVREGVAATVPRSISRASNGRLRRAIMIMKSKLTQSGGLAASTRMPWLDVFQRSPLRRADLGDG